MPRPAHPVRSRSGLSGRGGDRIITLEEQLAIAYGDIDRLTVERDDARSQTRIWEADSERRHQDHQDTKVACHGMLAEIDEAAAKGDLVEVRRLVKEAVRCL